MIARHSIDSVLNAALIEEVVGDYVNLKKRGVNLLGRCPFHDEKTPSFTVSPNKGIYKCFGCGKAGNAVSFLMEHDSLSFTEAIKRLAAKYRIEIEEDNIQNTEEYNEAQKKREGLLDVLQFSKKYFQNQLKTDEGKVNGESYFIERGFSPQTIATFELGYAPEGWENLAEEARKSQYNLQYFVEAGLLKKREEKESYYDVFRQRVVFPIHDLSGKVIAFGARQLIKDEKSAKYLNSPENEVYHKSNVLYGIFQAKKEIRNKDNCYLVEGYTDVITLHQAQIENVVASSGTSLTEGQIKLIKRFTDNVTVLYDGDAAGIKASMRGIDLILQEGLNVRVVSFPDGHDPDSYCKAIGAAEFQQFLTKQTNDFILFKVNLLMQEAGTDPIKKTEVLRNILESIALIPDALKRATYAHECSKILDADEKLLIVEINKIRKKRGEGLQLDSVNELVAEITQQSMPKNFQYESEYRQEEGLVRILIQSGSKLFMNDITVADFIFKELKEDEDLIIKNELFNEIIEQTKSHIEQELELKSDYYIHHENAQIRNLAATFFTEQYALSPYWEENGKLLRNEKENYKRDLQSVLIWLKLFKLDAIIKQRLSLLSGAKSEEEQIQLLQIHTNLLSLKEQLSQLAGNVVLPNA